MWVLNSNLACVKGYGTNREVMHGLILLWQFPSDLKIINLQTQFCHYLFHEYYSWSIKLVLSLGIEVGAFNIERPIFSKNWLLKHYGRAEFLIGYWISIITCLCFFIFFMHFEKLVCTKLVLLVKFITDFMWIRKVGVLSLLCW